MSTNPISGQVMFTNPATAHLGSAYRVTEEEWVVLDDYGMGVGTIWTPYLWQPGVYRCDPLPGAPAVAGHQSRHFGQVLDHALRQFRGSHENSNNEDRPQALPPRCNSPRRGLAGRVLANLRISR
ncbi:hypothetical protein JOD47_002120 [Arthrobacter tumbae]|nr:hypothetical protein [Arthrobacter tumbae]